MGMRRNDYTGIGNDDERTVGENIKGDHDYKQITDTTSIIPNLKQEVNHD